MLGHVAYDMYGYVRHMYMCSEALRVRAQELCESRGGRPGFPSLINKPTVSVDLKQHFNEALHVGRFGLTVRR